MDIQVNQKVISSDIEELLSKYSDIIVMYLTIIIINNKYIMINYLLLLYVNYFLTWYIIILYYIILHYIIIYIIIIYHIQII